MRLFPHVPQQPDETQLSFAARLAGFHGRGRPIPFLQDIGVDGHALAMGRRGAVERLADIAGVDAAALLANTVQGAGERKFLLRKEPLSAEMLTAGATVACPACLRDDDATNDPQPAQRIGRWQWLLGVTRTCPVHEIALVARRREAWDRKFHELSQLFPECGEALDRLVDAAPRRAPSPLQTHVAARIAGAVGNAWLDGQTIEQVVRGSEVLGAVLEFGVRANLKKLTSCDWDRAGRVGFPLMQRGPEGLREAFGRLIADARCKPRAGGPQKVYGRLYQWLNFNKSAKDLGPIRDVLREHILETMEVEAGAMVLGHVVKARRLHSVASLARTTREHPKTLTNLMVTHGLLTGADAHRMLDTFDASAAEERVVRAAGSIPVIRLPEALGATRPLVRQLLDAGLIQSMGSAATTARGTKHLSVEPEEVARFLHAISDGAPEAESAPDGFLTLARAAEHVGVRAFRLVELVLARSLAGVVRLRDVHGLAGLRFNPNEVQPFFERSPTGVALSIAARRLGLAFKVARKLAAPDTGAPILKTVGGIDPYGKHRELRVLEEEIERFQRDYVTLFALSADTGVHHIALAQRLRDARIEPIVDRRQISVSLFRRSDVETLPQV